MLAIGVLGFSMFRASAGCTRSDTALEPEAPTRAPATAAAPGIASEPAPAAPPIESERPTAVPPVKPGGKAVRPPSEFFPGTKSGSVHLHEENDDPPPSQAAPQK